MSASRRFYLDKAHGKIWGVCAGIADYTDIDVLWIRVGWVAAMFVTAGLPLALYLAIGLLADVKPGNF